jgi:diketogulonate reductase-like aldo/keto reductase
MEIHPYLPQTELVEFCQKNDISIVGYCPLSGPARDNSLKRPPNLLEDETMK